MKNLQLDFGITKFGRWTVLGEGVTTNIKRKVHCKCDCGTERDVMLTNLTTGISTSCGCYMRERIRETHRSHGMSGTSVYGIWQDMIRRCTDPRRRAYKSYGGRGITVCESWRQSFDNFYADMGPRPTEDYSIERIDNNGAYEKNNCKWATETEQQRNKRNSHILVYKGKSQNITAWGEEVGIDPETIRNRIVKLGWDVEKALETPTDAWIKEKKRNYPSVRSNTIWLTVDEVSKPLMLWAKETGLHPKVLRDRVRLGWNHKDIISLSPDLANGKGELKRNQTSS